VAHPQAAALFRESAPPDSNGLAATGYLGLIAAHQHDRPEAERLLRLLAAASPSVAFSSESNYTAAQIAGLLGDRERAVAFLSPQLDSPDDTSWIYSGLHREPDWDPLRGHQPFRELVRPKD
jgi:hypothetical protein